MGAQREPQPAADRGRLDRRELGQYGQGRRGRAHPADPVGHQQLSRLQLARKVREAREADAELWPPGAVHRIYGARQRIDLRRIAADRQERSEEHTSELQSLMRTSYAVFCLKKKNNNTITTT